MDAIWEGFLDLLPGNWDLFKDWAIWDFLLSGLWISVRIAAIAIVLSIFVGTTMAVGRLAPVPIVRILSTIYIEVFRATPLLLLLFFIFFGAGRFNTAWMKDIPLASYFVDLYNREFRKKVRGLTPAAIKLLEQYQWPGNIRELRNAIERAMLLLDHDWLEPDDFTTLTRTVSGAQFKLPAEGLNLEEVERQLLVQALERAGGNQTRAAELLGINRDQVRYRVEKFGLQMTRGN